MTPNVGVISQVLRQAEIGSGCWLWQGCQDGGGYAMVRIGGKTGRTQRSHRALWEALYGPVPNGFQLDHLCRVRHCVNPWHLEVVTPRENSLRGETVAALRAAQTHCIHGHALIGCNVIRKGNNRQCRECNYRYIRAWKARRKLEAIHA